MSLFVYHWRELPVLVCFVRRSCRALALGVVLGPGCGPWSWVWSLVLGVVLGPECGPWSWVWSLVLGVVLGPGCGPWSWVWSLVLGVVLGPGCGPWSWVWSLLLGVVLGPGCGPWSWVWSLVLAVVLGPGCGPWLWVWSLVLGVVLGLYRATTYPPTSCRYIYMATGGRWVGGFSDAIGRARTAKIAYVAIYAFISLLGKSMSLRWLPGLKSK